MTQAPIKGLLLFLCALVSKQARVFTGQASVVSGKAIVFSSQASVDF
jgi:hypothetical protein